MSMSRLYTLSTFSRQLATTMSSGVPVIDAIDAIAERTAVNGFQQVLRRIRDDLKGGATVTAAFEKHPDWFPGLYLAMVRVGELGGNLVVILQRLAGYLEKAASQQRQLFGGFVTPAVFAIILTMSGLHRISRVTRAGDHMYSGPLDVLAHVILLVAVLVVVLVRSASRGGWALALLRRIPVVAEAMVNLTMARFSRILGTLIGSGVPLRDALEITADHVGDPAAAAALRHVKPELASRGFATPLRETGAFTPVMVQMVAAGEATAKLNETLLRAADIYETESDLAVERLNRGAQTVLLFAVAGGMALLVQGLVLSRLVGTVIR